jgi:hypothetical protein
LRCRCADFVGASRRFLIKALLVIRSAPPRTELVRHDSESQRRERSFVAALLRMTAKSGDRGRDFCGGAGRLGKKLRSKRGPSSRRKCVRRSVGKTTKPKVKDGAPVIYELGKKLESKRVPPRAALVRDDNERQEGTANWETVWEAPLQGWVAGGGCAAAYLAGLHSAAAWGGGDLV